MNWVYMVKEMNNECKKNEELKWYKADLHVHSVLSPCGELEMGPENVIKKCDELDIKILGITDHNSGANVGAFKSKGQKKGISVIAGMEVQSREEVHCLCFFPSRDKLKYFEKEFKATLPKINNNPNIFGDQVVVNEEEEILYLENNLLLVSSYLSIKEILEMVENYEGGMIPAHIDKKHYSIIYNLGFIPSYNFLALEIFNYPNRGEKEKNYPEIKKFPLVVSSDAHNLDDMVNQYYTYFYLAEPNWEEIKLALKSKKGRKVEVFSGDIR